MLDIRWIRQNPRQMQEILKARLKDIPINELLEKDEERREVLSHAEEKKALRNSVSKRIGAARKNGLSAEEINRLTEELRTLGNEISSFDAQINALNDSIEQFMLSLPNIPHCSVPLGSGKADNVEVRRWGVPRHFPWEPKPHWNIGLDLDILDWESAAKISGTGVTVYRGLGARLERSLIQFFLNTHCGNGYEEIFAPLMVNRAAMLSSGQLPEYEKKAYKVNNDTFLVSAAEVPVINLYQEKILDGSKLPIRHCAFSTCFCSESVGAAGAAQGLTHQRQVNKVELVQITRPEQSYEALESITAAAEQLLQLLNLPYRVVMRCTGDLGFSAAKTYDIEVWMPSSNRYVKISSCSNCEDFQARRAGIRFRSSPKEKPQFVHTLNGSALTVEHTMAAILENHQNDDGSVTIPDVLVPYMGTSRIR